MPSLYSDLRKFDSLVLENLLKRGGALQQRAFLNEFPNDKRNDVLAAIANLQTLGYVMQDFAEKGIVITLVESRRKDALREVSSIYLADPSQVPIEEHIPKNYSKPFHIAEGEHLVNNAVSKYVFCHSKKDDEDITCFIINSSGNKYGMHLGNIHDSQSLVSKFLKEIDLKFSNVLFTKEDLKRNLPKELVGNNQPTKAATEYLLHEKYLVRHDYVDGTSKFERTGKAHSIDALDEILELHEPTPHTIMTINGAKYGYHEDDGLYPILY